MNPTHHNPATARFLTTTAAAFTRELPQPNVAKLYESADRMAAFDAAQQAAAAVIAARDSGATQQDIHTLRLRRDALKPCASVMDQYDRNQVGSL